MTPLPSLNDMIDAAGKLAQVKLVEQNGEVLPIFILMDAAGEISIVVTPWRNPAEKLAKIEALRQIAKERKAVQYSFICEAWMAQAPPGWKPGDSEIAASEQPNRIEVVTAVACDGKRQEYATWKIVRDADGKCTALERQPSADDMYASRFDNLLGATLQ